MEDEFILYFFGNLSGCEVLLAIEGENHINQLQRNQLTHNLDAVSLR